MLQDLGEGGPLDGAMRRNGELLRLVGGVLLQPYVAPSLPNDYPAIASKSPNHCLVVEARDLCHTAISTTSALAARLESSSTGSRYSLIASSILRSASSRVSPSLIHPGSEGTRAAEPPPRSVPTPPEVSFCAPFIPYFKPFTRFAQYRAGHQAHLPVQRLVGLFFNFSYGVMHVSVFIAICSSSGSGQLPVFNHFTFLMCQCWRGRTHHQGSANETSGEGR